MNIKNIEIPDFDNPEYACVHRCESANGTGLFVEVTDTEQLEAGFASAVPILGNEKPHLGDGEIAPAQEWV